MPYDGALHRLQCATCPSMYVLLDIAEKMRNLPGILGLCRKLLIRDKITTFVASVVSLFVQQIYSRVVLCNNLQEHGKHFVKSALNCIKVHKTTKMRGIMDFPELIEKKKDH
eukprot:scpid103379/ scgid28386/ 